MTYQNRQMIAWIAVFLFVMGLLVSAPGAAGKKKWIPECLELGEVSALDDDTQLVELDCFEVDSHRIAIYRWEQWKDDHWVERGRLELRVDHDGNLALWDPRENPGHWLSVDNLDAFESLASEVLTDMPSQAGRQMPDPCRAEPGCRSWVFEGAATGDEPGRRDRTLEQRPLGREGVAEWLGQTLDEIQRRGGVESGPPPPPGPPEQPQTRRFLDSTVLATRWRNLPLPRSSDLAWTLTDRFPERPRPFRLERSLPELPLGLDGPGGHLTGIGGLNGDPSSSHLFSILGNSTTAPSGTAAPCGVRVRVPQVLNTRQGLEWSWTPLGNAATDLSSGMSTSPDGCLTLQGKSYILFLKSPRIQVQALRARDCSIPQPESPVEVAIPVDGPHVFVDPGPEFLETLVAGNLYSLMHQALARLSQIDPLIDKKLRKLEVSQERYGSDCLGYWAHLGKVHLPLQCTTAQSFVPRGLCDDVVRHELMHEVLARLVSKGSVRGAMHPNIVEALADYFAIALRVEPEFWFYGRHCQHDAKWNHLQHGYGDLYQDSLLVTLGSLRELDLGDATEHELLDRLVLEAFREQPASLEGFANTLARLAVETNQRDFARHTCQALVDHAGFCASECRKFVSCSRLTSVRRFDKILKAEGFTLTQGSSSIPYELLLRDLNTGASSITDWPASTAPGEDPVDPTERVSIDLSEDTGPLEILLRMKGSGDDTLPDDLEPCPPRLDGSSEDPRACRYSLATVEGWPDMLWEPLGESLAAWVPTHSPRGDGREPLIAVDDSGRLGVVAVLPASGNDPTRRSVRLTSVLTRGQGDDLQVVRVRLPVTKNAEGAVQGWTYAGRQFEARPRLADDGSLDFEFVSGARRQQTPWEVEAQSRRLPDPVLDTDLRVEVLSWDALGVAIADWGADPPRIRRVRWHREIDHRSLRIVLDRQGSRHLMVRENLSGKTVVYRYSGTPQVVPREGGPPEEGTENAPGTRLSHLTLVQKDLWIAPTERPGIEVLRIDSGSPTSQHLDLEASLCHAPPYLERLPASGGDGELSQFLVLSCDGALALLDLGDTEPRWTPLPVGTEPSGTLPGVVPPATGLDPILAVDLGQQIRGWLVGPLRALDAAGKEVYRFWILDHNGNVIRTTRPIATPDAVLTAPRFHMAPGSGALELLIPSSAGIERWEGILEE